MLIVSFPKMMVKSPDPVNWTVPLDTGKTFTVTHNIPEGKTSSHPFLSLRITC